MAVKYVKRCSVMINNSSVEHMKSFKMLEEVYRTEVQLMNGVGSADGIPTFKFSIDYVIPKSNEKTDWDRIEDAMVIIQRIPTGKRFTYSGVDCLSVGEETMDGQQEAVRTITFLATRKDNS